MSVQNVIYFQIIEWFRAAFRKRQSVCVCGLIVELCAQIELPIDFAILNKNETASKSHNFNNSMRGSKIIGLT